MTERIVVEDLWPACPRCGDLCEPYSRYCPECGVALTLKSAPAVLASDPMSAALREGEAVQATRERAGC